MKRQRRETRREAPWGVCGREYSPYFPFDVFFYTKHLKGVSWDTNYPVLIELGSNVINPTDFCEEYGLGPCPRFNTDLLKI